MKAEKEGTIHRGVQASRAALVAMTMLAGGMVNLASAQEDMTSGHDGDQQTATERIYSNDGSRLGTVKQDGDRQLIYDKDGRRFGTAVPDGERILLYDKTGRRIGTITSRPSQ